MTNTYLLENEDGPMFFSREFAWLEPYADRKNDYVLKELFWVQWTNFGITYRIRVPEGFITDIASIPRFTWTFGGLLPDGLYRNAAIIHDILYMWQGAMPFGWCQKLVDGDWVNSYAHWSKNDCDRMFLRIMKACGVDRATRTKMYWAVTIFGWWAWWKTDKTRERYRNAFVMVESTRSVEPHM